MVSSMNLQNSLPELHLLHTKIKQFHNIELLSSEITWIYNRRTKRHQWT